MNTTLISQQNSDQISKKPIVASLNEIQVQKTLKTLHQESKSDLYKLGPVIAYKLYSLWLKRDLFEVMPVFVTRTLYLPVSEKFGERLNEVVISRQAKLIVEFGCSFGISTIYLAAAAKDTGGRVITTELDPIKCKAARENLIKAGLSDYVEIREGDALKTLADIEKGVDVLFLDGWKQLYKPLLDIMPPKLSKNALLIADDVKFSGAKEFNKVVDSPDSDFIITERGKKSIISYYKPTQEFLIENNLKAIPPVLKEEFTRKDEVKQGVSLFISGWKKLLLHPLEMGKDIASVVSHPIQTGKILFKELKKQPVGIIVNIGLSGLSGYVASYLLGSSSFIEARTTVLLVGTISLVTSQSVYIKNYLFTQSQKDN